MDELKRLVHEFENLEQGHRLAIRLPRKLSDMFNDYCKSNQINKGALVRKLMIEELHKKGVL